MIRTIKEIWVQPVDDSSGNWSQLPIVAGTAIIQIEMTNEDAGLLKTYSLSTTLRRPHVDISQNLRICIIYENGPSDYLGTVDVPVKFDSQWDNRLSISTKYKTRTDY